MTTTTYGMRVAIVPTTGNAPLAYGTFVGLVSNNQGCDRCDGDGYSAVVAVDGHGMILELFHPSRVAPYLSADEARRSV